MGATDVCPLVPVSGMTIDEVVPYAHQLAERIGSELNIPIYCYESAAKKPERQNLAYCRKGEYEGMNKIEKEEWTPDYGPNKFDDHVNSRGGVPYDLEVRYHHKNGSIVWVICRGRVVEWSEEGEPVRMQGVHIDITDMKKREDMVTEGDDVSAVTMNAPASEDGFFMVPKVIE